MSSRARLASLLAALAFGLPATSVAANYIGSSWPSGNIAMRLQLDATAPTSPTFPLTDGTTTWNALAQSAASDWNNVLGRVSFTLTPSPSTTRSYGDGNSDIFFSNTIYGSAFGSGVLAVTLVDSYDDANYPTVRTREADLIVNRGLTNGWNSYRGTIRSSPIDLRRVLLHELGHVLGLAHPDESEASDNAAIKNTIQFVAAIMNSRVSSTDTLQPDDISGVSFLYRNVIGRPIVTTQPASQTASVAASVTLAPGVDGIVGPPQDAFRSYSWYFKATGATSFEKLFTINSPTLAFGSVQLGDAGSYYLEIKTADDTVTTNTVTLAVTPVATAANTALANLSTRGIAGSGSNSMIVGFNVTGNRAKTILLRAVGPTLGAAFNVAGTLADPQLTLKNSQSATVATSAATWEQSSNLAEIRAASARVGAFALNAGSRDAVILQTLPPGSYTATTSSPAGSSGVVLVEAYDTDPVRDAASRLANLSTRGFTSTGANVLIAGFIVSGPGPRTYLIRAVGDSLRQFGVTGTLDDCILTLFAGSGAQLRVCDDWDSPKATQPSLSAAATQVGAFALGTGSTTGRQDSAMLVTLAPGNYTAQVSGNENNGSSSPTGVALVEIYELP
ncbi:MAG: matrixin family metalloprotease [Verrucomicrobia bacterium]|nr:matrixin family metalloprotease [Verrucomicrobiota bacterium]